MSNHDPQHVENVQKAGGFADSLDHKTLEMNPHDRQSMHKALSLQGSLQNSNNPPFPHRTTQTNRTGRAKTRKRTLWQIILDTLQLIFLGGRSGIEFYLSRWSRNHIRFSLSSFQGGVYDFRLNHVTSAFANYMFRIYIGLGPIKTLFHDSYCPLNSVNYNNESFFIRFVSEILHQDTLSLMEKFSTRRIRQIYEYDDEARNFLDRALFDFEAKFFENDYQTVASRSRLLELLASLARFEWEDFFKKFDSGFDPTLKQRPNFTGVPYSTIDKYLDDLIQLISPIQDVPDTPHMKEHLFHTLTIIRNKQTKQEDRSSSHLAPKPLSQDVLNLDYSVEQLDSLVHSINSLTKNEILVNLIRYNRTYKKSDSRNQKPERQTDFATQYLNVVRREAMTALKTTENETIINKLRLSICDLLGIENISELEAIANYDKNLVSRLRSRHMTVLPSYTVPAAITYHFCHGSFQSITQQWLDKFFIKAAVNDVEQRQIWAQTYQVLSESIQEILQWVDGIAAGKNKDTRMINRYIEGLLSESQNRGMVRSRIEELNVEIQSYIHAMRTAVSNLMPLVDGFIETLKRQASAYAPRSQSVSDLSQNKQLLDGMLATRDSLTSFIEIMKKLDQHSALYEPGLLSEEDEPPFKLGTMPDREFIPQTKVDQTETEGNIY